jgi:hypothetical protein
VGTRLAPDLESQVHLLVAPLCGFDVLECERLLVE